jgi:hypothetical protein
MSDMTLCPICDATERTILNSLAGANMLSIERRTLDPENQIGFDTLFQSISIAVIVEDTRRKSSCMIPYVFLARARTRSKDSFSTFFTIVSTSLIVMGEPFLRIYWVVI